MDVFVEVAVGQLGQEIAKVGVGLNGARLAGADQAGEAFKVPAALVMAGKEGVTSVHGRAADGVFDQVGIHVDAAIVEDGRGPWRQWRRVSPGPRKPS